MVLILGILGVVGIVWVFRHMGVILKFALRACFVVLAIFAILAKSDAEHRAAYKSAIPLVIHNESRGYTLRFVKDVVLECIMGEGENLGITREEQGQMVRDMRVVGDIVKGGFVEDYGEACERAHVDTMGINSNNEYWKKFVNEVDADVERKLDKYR